MSVLINWWCRFIFLVMLGGLPVMTFGQKQETIAFPGAEGFGKHTTGGRGGKVVFVDNLNDDGPGSLRAAVREKYPRYIVIRVSGTIELASPIKINEGNVTIAGQTAPGDGICLKNFPLVVSSGNVIIRFMRFRMGDEKGYEGDALSGLRRENVIIDHCSISWGTDEAATFYDGGNFTMQWCIIGESLNASVHHKGPHGYGGIWGGRKASFHHNLLTNNSSRNPRFCGARYHKEPEMEIVDFRNNVIYNWRINSSYGGEEGNHNMVNNYYKPGPATRENVSARIVNPSKPYGKFYVDGNYVDGNKKISDNNWQGGVQCDDPLATKLDQPVSCEPVTTHSPQEAYTLVLKYAGASLVRDEVDRRLIKEVEKGSYTYKGSVDGYPGIIDSQRDVGGWPILQTKKLPKDSDNDGMPDDWEVEHHLDPHDPTDVNGKDLHDDYENIEMYLNVLVKDISQFKAER